MKAEREGNTMVLRMTLEEAHVYVWGGPTRLYEDVRAEISKRLVELEDALTEDEYRERFGSLPAMYEAMQRGERRL